MNVLRAIFTLCFFAPLQGEQVVSVIGAPTSGPFIEGVLGSTRKGCRHRFYCHSGSQGEGFLGPQESAEPLSFKDQPGVFPAPSMGHASLTFLFNCESTEASFTPIVVKPDGTVFHGLPMTGQNSPQAVVIASPAQKGIYTLFILPHQNEAHATVKATVSTQPDQETTLHLKAFHPQIKEPELVSAEFVYIAS